MFMSKDIYNQGETTENYVLKLRDEKGTQVYVWGGANT